MKAALSLVSIALICIGIKFVSNGVDAGYDSHIRAFITLSWAVVFIFSGMVLFGFAVLGIIPP